MSMVPRKILCLLIGLSLLMGTAEGAYARASMALSAVSPAASHSMDEGMAMDGEMPCCPECSHESKVSPGLMSLCQFSCALVSCWTLVQPVVRAAHRGFPVVGPERDLIGAGVDPIPDIPKA